MILYKNAIKQGKRIAVDATGGIAKSIEKLNGKIKYIFLYQIVVEGEEQILPVFQMLSTKHDTISIQYWLQVLIKNAKQTPHECVSDFSFALLNAITLSFNNCRLETYVKQCLKLIFDGDF